MDVTEQDSAAIYALMQSIPRGTYTKNTLRQKLTNTKGPRPLHFKLKDVPDEIMRVGSRWGAVYMNARFALWGGAAAKQERERKEIARAKGYINFAMWQDTVERAIRIMPQKRVRMSTFTIYLKDAMKEMGLKRAPILAIAWGIVEKQIKTNITTEIVDGVLFITIKVAK